MTRLGDFWKFLAINFITKIVQMFGDSWGNFEKHYLFSQPVVATFGQLSGQIWLLFIITSGHTGNNKKCEIKTRPKLSFQILCEKFGMKSRKLERTIKHLPRKLHLHRANIFSAPASCDRNVGGGFCFSFNFYVPT